MEVILRIFFLTLSNADKWFVEKELEWKSYSTAGILPINQRFKLIDKEKFAAVALDKNAETFIIYVAALSAPII